jgi:hypothetical protein
MQSQREHGRKAKNEVNEVKGKGKGKGKLKGERKMKGKER